MAWIEYLFDRNASPSGKHEKRKKEPQINTQDDEKVFTEPTRSFTYASIYFRSLPLLI